MSKTKRRSPSPSPTITLDVSPKKELNRSSSDESIRVIHHAVIFPNSPYANRVSYIRRSFETDTELIRRQQAAIALQPLTFAEDLAAKRKQLEIRAQKRKQDKAAQATSKTTDHIPAITVIPPSGKANGKATVSVGPRASPQKQTQAIKEKEGLTLKPSHTTKPPQKQLNPNSTHQNGNSKANGRTKSPAPIASSSATTGLTSPTPTSTLTNPTPLVK